MNTECHVCPVEIAHKYNIEVIEDKNLNFDIHGYGEIKQDGRGTIACNPSLTELEKRFVIAHILGHFLLGHFSRENKKKFVETRENFNEITSFLEDEANKFALRLLIPKDKIEFLIVDKNLTDPCDIAKLLKVPKVSLLQMLEEYGYL